MILNGLHFGVLFFLIISLTCWIEVRKKRHQKFRDKLFADALRIAYFRHSLIQQYGPFTVVSKGGAYGGEFVLSHGLVFQFDARMEWNRKWNAHMECPINLYHWRSRAGLRNDRLLKNPRVIHDMAKVFQQDIIHPRVRTHTDDGEVIH